MRILFESPSCYALVILVVITIIRRNRSNRPKSGRQNGNNNNSRSQDSQNNGKNIEDFACGTKIGANQTTGAPPNGGEEESKHESNHWACLNKQPSQTIITDNPHTTSRPQVMTIVSESVQLRTGFTCLFPIMMTCGCCCCTTTVCCTG